MAAGGAQMPRALHQRLALDHPLPDEGVGGRAVGGDRDRIARRRLGFVIAAMAQQELRQIVARPQGVRRDRDQMAQPAFGARRVAAGLGSERGDFEQVDVVGRRRQLLRRGLRDGGCPPGVERLAQRIDRGGAAHGSRRSIVSAHAPIRRAMR